ncbi:PilW family protein [Xanthomonadaceae bacterium JHOS43]|nr:PilW family protein [Xanthomonadaceae bacterium JHOS43]
MKLWNNSLLPAGPLVCVTTLHRYGGRQQGISLVEMMVALVIASIVGIGLTQILISTKQAFNTNIALARAQENSRFALRFLNEDLRMVAHLGMRNEQGARPGAAEDPAGNLLFNHLAVASGATPRRPASAPWAYRLDIPFQAHEYNGTGMGQTLILPASPIVDGGTGGNWSPSLAGTPLASLASEALTGSDIIVMRYLSAEFVTLVNSGPRPDGLAISANIPFDSATGRFFWLTGGNPGFIQSGGIYAFSNARAISLFQVTTVGTPAGGEASATALGGLNTLDWVTTPPLGASGEIENSADYGSLLPVHRYEMVIYYVALGADGGPSLFRRRLDPAATNGLGSREELVPGVESMQVVLGVANRNYPRNADQPTAYMTADNLSSTTWGTGSPDAEARLRSVVSSRVGLLMRSQQAGSDQESHNVAGTNVTVGATDRQLRFVYETQVSFRNRNRG